MKSKSIVFAFLFVGSFLSSCYTEIEIVTDDQPSVMVLNAWLKSGESPLIDLSASNSIIQNKNTEVITNAEVYLYENGLLLGQLNQNAEGLYANEAIVILAGNTYKITASATGFPDISSESTVQPTLAYPDFEINIDHALEETTDGYYSYFTNWEVLIEDDPLEANYYLVRLLREYKSWSEGSTDTLTKYSFDQEIIQQNTPVHGSYWNDLTRMYILSDELFNGTTFVASFKNHDLRTMVNLDNPSQQYSSRYIIELHEINEAFYRYVQAIKTNKYPDNFTEPLQMYSNVENGYGALFTSSILKNTINEPAPF